MIGSSKNNRENAFEHKKQKAGLSANRPSNNWVYIEKRFCLQLSGTNALSNLFTRNINWFTLQSYQYRPGVSIERGFPFIDPVPMLVFVCSHAMCWNVKNTWCFSVSWVGSWILTWNQTKETSHKDYIHIVERIQVQFFFLSLRSPLFSSVNYVFL